MVLVVLIPLGLGAVLVSSQQYWKEKRGIKVHKEQLRIAEEVLANNEAKLMSIQGVVGVGIGLTEKGDRPAIHIYVNVDAIRGTMPAAIPKQIDNVPVRVIETDEIKAQ